MKNTIKKLSLTLSIVFIASAAHASGESTTISVSGNVIAGACTTGASDNYTFDLGQQIPVASLQKYGDLTPSDSKEIVLSNCPNGTTSVTATFSGTPFADSKTNFQNDGTAKNIGINLTGPGNVTYSNGSTVTVNVGSDRKAVFPLTAKGVSTGNATIGTIQSAVVMTFTYN